MASLMISGVIDADDRCHAIAVWIQIVAAKRDRVAGASFIIQTLDEPQ
jgi:hypothetical protein